MRLRRGQSIMELLIALAVIAIGLFAAVTLVYSNLNLVERDADEVVAVNLAREGVELAKQKRDSNWLAGSAFDAGMVSSVDPMDYTATPVWEGAYFASPITDPSFDFTANTLTDATPKLNIVRTYNNLLANNSSGSAEPATPFKRLLTFHPICSDYTVLDSGSACSGAISKIGIRVESRVRWTRKALLKEFVLYDDLYDWR